jgi:quercetin dioxygenase-like cupin family protein
MEIVPKQPTIKGTPDTFTGDVWVDGLARGRAPGRANVNAVHFSPGARTAWHAHALGQTLYVTEGRGRIQSRGQSIVEIHPGDVIFTPDGEEHWHGAAPDHFMVHLSVTEGDPTWGGHVTDAEYGATPANR